MMKAVEVARDRRIPFFGICYGFQWAAVEYARNVCGIAEADSTEVAPETRRQGDLQAARPARRRRPRRHHAPRLLRLPAEARLARARLYGADVIHERHRHRYEFNCLYEPAITEKGLEIVGRSLDGKFVEMVELPAHPWFVAVQFHPEFKSKPLQAASAVCRIRRSGRTRKLAAAAAVAANVTAIGDRRRALGPAARRASAIRRAPSGLSAVDNAVVHRYMATCSVPAELVLIAGPCVIESETHALELGHAIAAIARDGRRPLHLQGVVRQGQPHVAVARSAVPASTTGLRILGRVKAELGVPVLTDIHEAAQAAPAAAVVDVLQIPAFLCRQTDLLVAAARTGRRREHQEGPVPRARGHAARRSRRSARRATRSVLLTERGTSFGYHNLVVDMRAFPQMRALGDAGDLRRHPQPAAAGRRRRRTAGQAAYIETMASAGVAAGVDGVFMEVHEEPPRAKSDAENALASRPAARAAAATAAGPRGRPGGVVTVMTEPPARRVRPRSNSRHACCAPRPRPSKDSSPASTGASSRPSRCWRLPRPRRRHRHGQVGPHLPEDRRDAREHRHAGLLPAPGRSPPRRSRRRDSRRRGGGAVVRRRDAGGRAPRRDRRSGSVRG